MTSLSPATGSNVSCYTGTVPSDGGFTNFASKTADLQHTRSLCMAAVDVAADTVRANVISANEVQAQIITQTNPITAAIAVHDTTLTIGQQVLAGPIEQYIGAVAPGNLSFVFDSSNDVTLASPVANGLVVGSDGWYQVSFNIGRPTASAQMQVGVGINADTASAVPLATVTTGAPVPGFVSGSTLMDLVAGDIVQLFLFGVAADTFDVPSNLIRLTVARIGP